MIRNDFYRSFISYSIFEILRSVWFVNEIICNVKLWTKRNDVLVQRVHSTNSEDKYERSVVHDQVGFFKMISGH